MTSIDEQWHQKGNCTAVPGNGVIFTIADCVFRHTVMVFVVHRCNCFSPTLHTPQIVVYGQVNTTPATQTGHRVYGEVNTTPETQTGHRVYGEVNTTPATQTGQRAYG